MPTPPPGTISIPLAPHGRIESCAKGVAIDILARLLPHATQQQLEQLVDALAIYAADRPSVERANAGGLG